MAAYLGHCRGDYYTYYQYIHSHVVDKQLISARGSPKMYPYGQYQFGKVERNTCLGLSLLTREVE